MEISKNDYVKFKEIGVQGRYVVNEQIIAFLNKSKVGSRSETIGRSVKGQVINSLTLGVGQNKILMWSQMHGNESTTTKAVLDLINMLSSESGVADKILQCCTLKIVPILNPDGAETYTRFNANQIDLNRDAQNQSQPESSVLRTVYDDFEPDFCFNLHDQRTIYNVGTTSKPATVSFLAPAFDPERSISKSRTIAMKLIAAMNELLQKWIPGQVGRYDDGFNANCVGDAFQMLKTPTILFEAGHDYEDYEREKTREYIFYALVKALKTISNDEIEHYNQDAYLNIPENGKRFFDILVKNVPSAKVSGRKDIGILYKEVLENGVISFVPYVEQIGNLEGFFGHKTYDYLNSNDFSYLRKANFQKLFSI